MKIQIDTELKTIVPASDSAADRQHAIQSLGAAVSLGLMVAGYRFTGVDTPGAPDRLDLRLAGDRQEAAGNAAAARHAPSRPIAPEDLSGGQRDALCAVLGVEELGEKIRKNRLRLSTVPGPRSPYSDHLNLLTKANYVQGRANIEDESIVYNVTRLGFELLGYGDGGGCHVRRP